MIKDFKSFTEDNFDHVNWINDTLKPSEKEENSENYASTMVYKLQVFIQEINQSLEESALDVIKEIPKIQEQIDNLSEEATKFI